MEFFADLVDLNEAKAFAASLAALRSTEWLVYAKKTFAGPEQLLGYLARYTHRVAITNNRLLAFDESHVSFRWKKYRQRGDHKRKVMRIGVAEFMRRFLLHVLPNGFHRIRHYGFLANGGRADKLALCRSLLAVPAVPEDRGNDVRGGAFPSDAFPYYHETPPCPCCGGRRLRVTKTFEGSLYRPYPVRKPDGF